MAKYYEIQLENQQLLVVFVFCCDGSLFCKGKIEDGNIVYFEVDSRIFRQFWVFIFFEFEMGILFISFSIEWLERCQAFEFCL